MQRHHIALLPRTLNLQVAILQFTLDLLSVDLHLIAAQHVVAEAVEVAGNGLFVYPLRNANHHTEVLSLILQYLNGYITIPRIVGLLLQYDILALNLHRCRVACIQVDIELTVLDGIHIARERGDETAEVRGTAGTSEPRLALFGIVGIEGIFAVSSQRVGIEETTSVDTHSTDDTIIQGAFQAVDVLGVTMQEEHTMEQIDHRNCGTRLVIGSQIGQFIISTESLSLMTRSDTTRDVILL